MNEVLTFITLALDATLRVATPLILAALAGLFSERSGIVDIGLEGKMLVGAFAAGAVSYWTGYAWLGLGAAILVSISFALLHGLACITYQGNQVVSGVAINILASGLTTILGLAWFHQGGATPPLVGGQRFGEITLPFAESLKGVPIVGDLYANVLSGHNILVYIALVLVPLCAWVLYKTRFGLRIRAVGENPKAVDTAGISVSLLRYRAVIIAGALCGIAGTYLSTAQNAQFIRDMTAGQGFMALAALIFAKWRPWPVLGAALLFGFLDALAIRMQGVSLPVIGQVPVQLIESLPYLLTVILLAGFIGKASPPKALGLPYLKEQR